MVSCLVVGFVVFLLKLSPQVVDSGYPIQDKSQTLKWATFNNVTIRIQYFSGNFDHMFWFRRFNMNGEMHLLLENDFMGLPSFELLEYWVTVATVYYQVGGIFAIDESRRCGCFPSLFYHDPPCKAIKTFLSNP